MDPDDLPPMPSDEPATVLVAAQDTVFFEKVQRTVEPHTCLRARDLEGALATLHGANVEVVVIDFDQTVPVSGVDIVLGLGQRAPGLKLLYPTDDAFSPTVFGLIEHGHYGCLRKTPEGYASLRVQVEKTIFVERRMTLWFPLLWKFVGDMRAALEPTVRVHDADVEPIDDERLRAQLQTMLRRGLEASFHRPPPSDEQAAALLDDLPHMLEQAVYGYVVDRIGNTRAAARALDIPHAELREIVSGEPDPPR